MRTFVILTLATSLTFPLLGEDMCQERSTALFRDTPSSSTVVAPRCRDVEFTIDPALEPSRDALPGLDGGPPRPVAAAAGARGHPMEFVENEIIVHSRNAAELQSLLERYGGTIVRDGAPFPGDVPPDGESTSGWYLLRIDPLRSELSDLTESLASGPRGARYRFSSEAAARTIALVARESAKNASLNFVLRPAAVQEHPLGGGTFMDASTWNWMTEDDIPSTPGIDGLSVGVIHAWDYLRYLGFPPKSGSFSPARIAIIDDGFDLDPASGLPLTGGRDFFNPDVAPWQADIVDHDPYAGGQNGTPCSTTNPCLWHGHSVAGVATAVPGNQYGGAGTGGYVVRPMLLRTPGDLYVTAQAVQHAVLSGADVVNISRGGGCSVDFQWLCTLPPDDGYEMMEAAAVTARGLCTIIVASAMNEGVDITDEDVVPCKTPYVICVGSVDASGKNVYNFGDPVDIWAPTNVRSTVTPESALKDADDIGQDEVAIFGGTSASAPFIAGVVGMMKVLDRRLTVDVVQDILQQTANPSSDSRVARGYVDAFRAVSAVWPNQRPLVRITSPSTASWTSARLTAGVTDPELGSGDTDEWPMTIEFRSDRDGTLCTLTRTPYVCTTGALATGLHQVSVLATDAFGATGSASALLDVINHPPVATLTEPKAGGTYYAHQPVHVAAVIEDPDESIPNESVRWSSSLDGDLGAGWNRNVPLSRGTHEITVTAVDGKGLSATDHVSIVVQSGDGYPRVTITSPSSTITVLPGSKISLRGEAVDPEDGKLTGARLAWRSSIDGALGTGEAIDVVLSGPATPCKPELVVHTITLQATDSDGHSIEVSLLIQVGKAC